MKHITIGIPAYKAKDVIANALSSIQIQTMKQICTVIIASDSSTEDYSYLKQQYPDLDIVTLTCEKNTGPGLARQRCIDACTTEWITFIDADDSFYSPFSIEHLFTGITENCVVVQATFLEEMPYEINGARFLTINTNHGWVFGRLYNLNFLKNNNIRFSNLRSSEDCEFNFKVRMAVEKTHSLVNIINKPVYLWRRASENSITRIGMKENGGIPLYNNDLSPVGGTVAVINVIKYCKEIELFNDTVKSFIAQYIMQLYFNYVKVIEQSPIFQKQALFNAKRFYQTCYREIEQDITKDMLTKAYLSLVSEAEYIPTITFSNFIDKIKEANYGGKQEFLEIRAELPDWVEELDLKCGALDEEGYIYANGENL